MRRIMIIKLKNGNTIYENEVILKNIFKHINYAVILNLVFVLVDDQVVVDEITQQIISELDKLKLH